MNESFVLVAGDGQYYCPSQEDLLTPFKEKAWRIQGRELAQEGADKLYEYGLGSFAVEAFP